MTGYIRKDTTNNIADGNVINATDLDNEFDGIQAAFVAATGHTHDGTASEGAAITKIGPVQDVVVSIASMYPKITNTVDLGTSSLKYKDAFFAGNETVGGTLTVTGVTTLTAQPVLSSLTASQAVFTNGTKGLVSNAITGTGNVVMSTSPTLVTPALGTPSALVGTNITGTATNFTASNVTTNANLTGAVTSVGNASSLGSFTSLQLKTALTDETGSGAAVFATSPTLVTPALGTPSSGVVTNLTGTASININGTVGATTPAAGSFTNITGSANAIISVTDNTNAALRITQLGTGNALLVEDSGNPDSTPVVIDASGNIIQGYTSQITSGSSQRNIQSVGTSNNTGFSGIDYTNDATTNALLGLFKSRGGTINTYTAVNSGDRLGIINWGGADGTAFVNAARIEAYVDGTPGTNDMPGRLVFSTTPDGAAVPVESMRIDRFGAVILGGTQISNASAFTLRRNITGGTSAYGTLQYGAIQSDVTTTAAMFQSSPSTAAASFILPSLAHFQATPQAFGAGSSVTNQYGFYVTSGLTGATNNFGFYSAVTSGTGRYGFYSAGSAENYFAGSTTIAGTTNLGAAVNTGLGVTTGAASFELGASRTGDGNTFIDFHAASGTDNEFRIIRAGGIDGNVNLTNSGAGTFSLQQSGAGNILFQLNGGNVGIGTTTPASRLSSTGSSATDFKALTLRNSNLTTGSAAVLNFETSGGTEGDITSSAAQIKGVRTGAGVSGALAFWTSASGVSAERMRITNAGNIGIGTTNPLVKLEVEGSTGTAGTSTASIAGTTMTVTAVANGTFVVGDLIYGANIQPYTRITAFGTGTGGVGTYTVSVSQTVASTQVTRNDDYGGTVIRITNLDVTETTGQPTGGLQFYTSDSSAPTAGVGAYVAAMAESATPDTALVFGTRNDTGGGIDANERMRIDSAGNVNFTGTAQRITGDFSNATVASRLMFQSSTVNGLTSISTIPNGTASQSGINLYNTADPTNSSVTRVYINNTLSIVDSGITGTGTYLPMAFNTGGAERMRIDTSGNVGIGTNSPAQQLHISGPSPRIEMTDTDTGADCYVSAASGTGALVLSADENNEVASSSMSFRVDGTERMRIAATGSLLVDCTTVPNVGAAGQYGFSVANTEVVISKAVNTTALFVKNLGGANATAINFYNGTIQAGSISTTAAGATAYNTSSDYRLKNITGPITTSGAYIDSLKPVEGTWKTDGSTFVGLIAHETQEASRTTVATGTKDGAEMQGMDYSSAEIIANLIAELQSLRARVAQLESK